MCRRRCVVFVGDVGVIVVGFVVAVGAIVVFVFAVGAIVIFAGIFFSVVGGDVAGVVSVDVVAGCFVGGFGDVGGVFLSLQLTFTPSHRHPAHTS